jgi:catechol 2,3-dioxygenase-like lactoylglutathione lyase family enzyme
MLWYLGYVVLFVEDFEQTVAFYEEKVGLPVRLRADGYVELAVQGAKLALLSRRRVPELVGDAHNARPAAGAHEGTVTVIVEDVDRAYGELSGRGVPFLGPPENRPWGQRTAYFHDPEGHLIEIAINLPRPSRTGT